MSKKKKNNNPTSKNKTKGNSNYKTNSSNGKIKSNKNVVAKEPLTGWKTKSALGVLILEALIAVVMLVKIFSRSSFTIFNGNKIVWGVYLAIQIILGFTILSKKIDRTKATFHWESVLITITYIFLP